MTADPKAPKVGDVFVRAVGDEAIVTAIGRESLLFLDRDGNERFASLEIVKGGWRPKPEPLITEPVTLRPVYDRYGVRWRGTIASGAPSIALIPEAAITILPDHNLDRGDAMSSVHTVKGGERRLLPSWPERPVAPAARPPTDPNAPGLFDVTPFDEGLPELTLPLAPLLFHFHGDKEALALAAGVDVRSVQRWALSGVSLLDADWLSCRTLGWNPVDVWGPDWDKPTATGCTETEEP